MAAGKRKLNLIIISIACLVKHDKYAVTLHLITGFPCYLTTINMFSDFGRLIR